MLHPDFVEMLETLRLSDAVTAISESTPEVSVRLNRAKPRPAVASTVGSVSVPWCDEGLYLPLRPSFTLDPEWHQGLYYVQEAGSMFHSHVVRSLHGDTVTPLKVLDACAAPGGKTTAVIDAVPGGSLVVANEFVPARAAVLKENIIKWGYPIVIVTRADTACYAALGETFDLIVADVPCSGEGMMRKDTEAVSQWSPALVQECASRQWEIVSNLWEALRPGGVMIYSTCTFNRAENEETVMRICSELGGETIVVPIDPSWGITPALTADGTPDPALHAYRFIPGRTRGEGLFVAAIRKDGETSFITEHFARQERPAARKDKQRGKGGSPSANWLRSPKGGALTIPTDWIKDAGELVTYSDGNRINAFPRQYQSVLERIKRNMDVIHEGVTLGTVKGRDLLPSQSLAMSTALAPNAFPRADIDLDTALAYLRGNSPVLPADTPRGFVLLTFNNHPLGFVKNLGNRSNSLYPWRILS